jgi:4-hydroxybenzoyl-CoA reductase subunit beta
MIRLPAFAYVSPRTVEQAVRAVADAGPEAMLVAGGTDLYPNMKRRQFEPKTLVGLRAITELRGVHGSGRQGLRIGSCTTLTAVTRHPEVGRAYAGLATAAGLVSSPQLRNMGTLGGNVCVDTRCNYYNQSYEWRRAIGFCMKRDGDICLVAPGSPRCWAVSSSDTAPALWSLGAQVRLVGPGGERLVPIAALSSSCGAAARSTFRSWAWRRPCSSRATSCVPRASCWARWPRCRARRPGRPPCWWGSASPAR